MSDSPVEFDRHEQTIITAALNILNRKFEGKLHFEICEFNGFESYLIADEVVEAELKHKKRLEAHYRNAVKTLNVDLE